MTKIRGIGQGSDRPGSGPKPASEAGLSYRLSAQAICDPISMVGLFSSHAIMIKPTAAFGITMRSPDLQVLLMLSSISVGVPPITAMLLASGQ